MWIKKRRRQLNACNLTFRCGEYIVRSILKRLFACMNVPGYALLMRVMMSKSKTKYLIHSRYIGYPREIKFRWEVCVDDRCFFSFRSNICSPRGTSEQIFLRRGAFYDVRALTLIKIQSKLSQMHHERVMRSWCAIENFCAQILMKNFWSLSTKLFTA